MTTEDYVVVHVRAVRCYWDGSGWTEDVDKVKTYSYMGATEVIWRVLDEPTEGRYTAVPLFALKGG